MPETLPHLDYSPIFPKRLDHEIAVIGAGGIVNYAHLPAYKKVGFKVIGITDRDRDRAEHTAKEHSIPRVFGSVDELLADPKVKIVDIAVYPKEQAVSWSKRLPPANICSAKSCAQRCACGARRGEDRSQSADALGRWHSLCPHPDRQRMAWNANLRLYPGALQNRLEPLALDL